MNEKMKSLEKKSIKMKESKVVKRFEKMSKLSFEELVFDFYKLIHGTEPSEKEWDTIKEVAKEAGVIE